MGGFVEHYNERRLNSPIGFVTPRDKLAGRERDTFADRDRKREVARESRQLRRQAARAETEKFMPKIVCNSETAGAYC